MSELSELQAIPFQDVFQEEKCQDHCDKYLSHVVESLGALWAQGIRPATWNAPLPVNVPQIEANDLPAPAADEEGQHEAHQTPDPAPGRMQHEDDAVTMTDEETLFVPPRLSEDELLGMPTANQLLAGQLGLPEFSSETRFLLRVEPCNA
ncbi:unnamed protein product [Symbiodinium natans]|uniref:Uncharacterized protein n=1 Tax=Symbiodinium natans TaxID=878477 RepID=A0A812K4H6_9DINO|nr:unnamed protein product [Symbiodinium natans]